jgi:uncharacterized phage-associated protein
MGFAQKVRGFCAGMGLFVQTERLYGKVGHHPHAYSREATGDIPRMYDARTIANELIKLASEAGQPLTNMQIQKLVYIAHGYALAIFGGEPLVKQSVEAWRYGPVIPVLYHSLREYGAGFVKNPIAMVPNESLDETDRALVAKVFSAYRGFTGPQLSTMTHKHGTPWSTIYDPRPEFQSKVIPNELIKEYYSKLLDERAGIKAA